MYHKGIIYQGTSDLTEMVDYLQGRIGDYKNDRCTIEDITLGVALKISNALDYTIEALFNTEEQA